jgi:hypothetical protein
MILRAAGERVAMHLTHHLHRTPRPPVDPGPGRRKAGACGRMFLVSILLVACTPPAKDVVAGLEGGDGTEAVDGGVGGTIDSGTADPDGSSTTSSTDPTSTDATDTNAGTGGSVDADFACEQTPADQLNAVWGAASDDVFAVGASGRIVRWDGASWTTMVSFTGETLRSVWGSASNDVFAMPGNLRWDGTSWTGATSPTSYRVVWGNGPDDVFAAGNAYVGHNDGSGWSTLGDPTVFDEHEVTPFNALWSTGPDNVLVGGGYDHALGEPGTLSARIVSVHTLKRRSRQFSRSKRRDVRRGRGRGR